MLCGKISCCIEIDSEFWLRPSPFYRHKQFFTSPLVSNIYKTSEDFFIQLLYAWLSLTNNNFPAFISAEEILDQPIFLNPHNRIDFKHPTQEYFSQIHHY